MPAAKSPKKLLKTYQAKRNFEKSPEPSGKSAAKPANSRKGLIFCVQKHLASHLHYDFRLEYHGVLLSWAVPKGPSVNPADKRLAMRVEDHPRDYADFEGVIPEGYGAGIVMVWDNGYWVPESDDVDAALKKGDLKFTLEGVKLKGSWVLVRTGRGEQWAESKTWLLIKHRDDWAGEIDITEAAPKSVKSFGDFADILGANQPAIWQSHKPEGNSQASAMLHGIIEEAARRKLKASKSKKRSASKKTVAKKPVKRGTK